MNGIGHRLLSLFLLTSSHWSPFASIQLPHGEVRQHVSSLGGMRSLWLEFSVDNDSPPWEMLELLSHVTRSPLVTAAVGVGLLPSHYGDVSAPGVPDAFEWNHFLLLGWWGLRQNRVTKR